MIYKVAKVSGDESKCGNLDLSQTVAPPVFSEVSDWVDAHQKGGWLTVCFEEEFLL